MLSSLVVTATFNPQGSLPPISCSPVSWHSPTGDVKEIWGLILHQTYLLFPPETIKAGKGKTPGVRAWLSAIPGYSAASHNSPGKPNHPTSFLQCPYTQGWHQHCPAAWREISLCNMKISGPLWRSYPCSQGRGVRAWEGSCCCQFSSWPHYTEEYFSMCLLWEKKSL